MIILHLQKIHTSLMKFFVLDISRIGFAAANFSIFSEKLESILRNFSAAQKQNYSPRCSHLLCRSFLACRQSSAIQEARIFLSSTCFFIAGAATLIYTSTFTIVANSSDSVVTVLPLKSYCLRCQSTS